MTYHMTIEERINSAREAIQRKTAEIEQTTDPARIEWLQQDLVKKQELLRWLEQEQARRHRSREARKERKRSPEAQQRAAREKARRQIATIERQLAKRRRAYEYFERMRPRNPAYYQRELENCGLAIRLLEHRRDTLAELDM